jgi:uncharacterized membrane protein YgcG
MSREVFAREFPASLKRVAAHLVLLSMLAFAIAALATPSAVQADEGWVIRSFEATYQINPDGSIDVVEDIEVDFGSLQRRGILRDIPVEYAYSSDYTRRISIEVVRVDDGNRAHKYQTSRSGAILTIRIGDPDVYISGQQRYRIAYRLEGMLNPQASWDEFYWNVTGNQWPVPILKAGATVGAPAVADATCFQGGTGSTQACSSQLSGSSARFVATAPQQPGGGLTIVVAMPQGSVNVPPFDLVRIKSVEEKVKDWIGLKPLPMLLALGFGIMSLGSVGRYWWLSGRDRWFGDVHYLTGASQEQPRPFFARDTVVVEFQPPRLEKQKRRLRPAEIGTLLDERADTKDVSATIVDLAVRGYLRIVEIPKSNLFGKVDYSLESNNPADKELLAYERKLLSSLFKSGEVVRMSDLKNSFYSDLAKVKDELYKQVASKNHFFPGNPESVRSMHSGIGIGLMVAGGVMVWLLGEAFGAAILGVPVIVAGLVMAIFSRAMPRRTAEGREMYRRCLGFREYMVIGETDRQRFAEEANIFQEYLPYAIVYNCVDKWSRAFEGLSDQRQNGGWYISNRPFTPLAFSRSLESFSSSISTSIASTPGGSGSSGFSGGSSGGGGGGGGGGSW